MFICFLKQLGTQKSGSQLPNRELRIKGPELFIANRKAKMETDPVLYRVWMKSFGHSLENIFI